MRKFMIFSTIVLLAAVAYRAQAALLISEVLYNEVGSDSQGEWIEIFNTGSAAIDLSGYKIGDEEVMNPPTSENGGMWQFPAGATIGAREVQIVAVGGTRFNTVYGFNPHYEVVDSDPTVANMSHYSAWSNNPNSVINMSNSNDQALLIDANDELIDAVSWGNTFAFDPGLADVEADGQSYERINALVDTNTAADWQLGNLSSPGTVAIPEPATTVLGMLAIAATLLSRSRPY